MKICDVLATYKRSDLNRLAKDKIANYVGLPVDILRDELCKVLTTYDHIKRKIQFRKPPGYTILDIIVNRQDFSAPIQEIKGIVQEEINNVIEEARKGEGLMEAKQFDLYAKMLKTAWDFQEDLLPPEANLLSALREYLNITRGEHRLLEAQLEVFKFNQASFSREIEHFAREGIIFTHETDYVIPEETVERIKEVWGIELDPEPYKRLLSNLTSSQLYSALGKLEGSMTKSGVNKMWQVFEWKHIISTSNFQLKGDLPHEQEYLKGISFARVGIFHDYMGGKREGDSFKAEGRESGFMSCMRSQQL